MSSAVQREGRAVHETPQVVVFVKVSYSVLHLVCVKVRLHVGYLDVGLQEGTQVCAVKYSASGGHTDEMISAPSFLVAQ